jgi:hypothetical protein
MPGATPGVCAIKVPFVGGGAALIVARGSGSRTIFSRGVRPIVRAIAPTVTAAPITAAPACVSADFLQAVGEGSGACQTAMPSSGRGTGKADRIGSISAPAWLSGEDGEAEPSEEAVAES